MALGNPSVIDDETREHFAMDKSGRDKFKAKYHHVTMVVSPDAFFVLVDAVNQYKRQHGLKADDAEAVLLDSIDCKFRQLEQPPTD